MWCQFYVLSIYFEYHKNKWGKKVLFKNHPDTSTAYSHSVLVYLHCKQSQVTEIVFIKSWKMLYFSMKCDMILLCHRAQMCKQLWNCLQGINFLYVICKFLVTQWLHNAYWHFKRSFSVSKIISLAFANQTLCYGFLAIDIFIYILNGPCNPEYLEETFLCHIHTVQINGRHFFRDEILIILRFVAIVNLTSPRPKS